MTPINKYSVNHWTYRPVINLTAAIHCFYYKAMLNKPLQYQVNAAGAHFNTINADMS